jgi:hypothetical protein
MDASALLKTVRYRSIFNLRGHNCLFILGPGARRGWRLPVEKHPPNRERDIMFLSKVADPERCHALSGNAHDR